MLHRALISSLFLSGCAPEQVTYHEVEPILRAHCVGCHRDEGIGPFALDTYAAAVRVASKIGPALEDRVMPPLPPDTSACRPLDDPRELADADRRLVLDWIDGGAVQGRATPRSEPIDSLGPPADVFDAGLDYVSDFAGDDEYRCFVVDPAFTQRVDGVAFGVRATNPAAVHHAEIYAAPPSSTETVDALDAGDPVPGWPCLGGAGFAEAIPLGLGVPGSRVWPFPEGTGMPLVPGTRFVVQLHLHLEAGPDVGGFAVEMWHAPGPIASVPFRARAGSADILVPAGDPDVAVTASTDLVAAGEETEPFERDREGRAWIVGGHMHRIGKSIRVAVVHRDGARECLLDVPRWDFDWQGEYRFAAPIDLVDGDRLEVECRWDNSLGTEDVRWGEGTADEMCIGWVMLTELG